MRVKDLIRELMEMPMDADIVVAARLDNQYEWEELKIFGIVDYKDGCAGIVCDIKIDD